MNRVALVTGASGFAGSHLCVWLRSKGWSVREATNPGGHQSDSAFPCDIADAEQVGRLLKWTGTVTHAFHLAAVTFVPLSSRNPALTMDVNVNGTILLASALADYCSKARLIYISSAAIYGIPEYLPVTETHRLAPKEPYAISKAAADAYCEYLHKSTGADIVRLRPFNHSGAGQPDSFVLSSFAHQIARIEAGLEPPVLRVGNLEAARDFLHVNDVVKAYECAALEGVSGEAYNVCSGMPFTIRDALDIMLAQARTHITIETENARLRPVDIPVIAGSHEKLTAQTGWRPEISFQQLISELLEFWRKTP